MNKLDWCIVAGLVLLVTVVGCRKSGDTGEKQSGKTSADQLKQQASQAMNSTRDYMASKKEQFVQDSQEKLDALQQKYDQWKQHASVEGAEAKQKLAELEDNFANRLSSAKDTLGKVKEAGLDTWQKTASGVDEAVKQLQDAYDSLVSYVASIGQKPADR
jgi:CHASE3 domain sensor protein